MWLLLFYFNEIMVRLTGLVSGSRLRVDAGALGGVPGSLAGWARHTATPVTSGKSFIFSEALLPQLQNKNKMVSRGSWWGSCITPVNSKV